jgi:hypothetical protein
MDLQATAQLLGNFGEFFGAIAVVVTLVYLAGQLNQNTKALRSASYEHWNEISGMFTDFLARHAAELTEIQTNASVQDLTAQQRTVLMSLSIKAMDQAQTADLHFRAGTLDEDVFESRIRSYCSFLDTTPLVKQLWPQLKNYPTPAFAALVDTRVAGLSDSGEFVAQSLFE